MPGSQPHLHPCRGVKHLVLEAIPTHVDDKTAIRAVSMNSLKSIMSCQPSCFPWWQNYLHGWGQSSGYGLPGLQQVFQHCLSQHPHKQAQQVWQWGGLGTAWPADPRGWQSLPQGPAGGKCTSFGSLLSRCITLLKNSLLGSQKFTFGSFSYCIHNICKAWTTKIKLIQS